MKVMPSACASESWKVKSVVKLADVYRSGKEGASRFVGPAICQLQPAIVQVCGPVELHTGRRGKSHAEVDGGGVRIDRKHRGYDGTVVQAR